jgi:hypothetical protein
VRESTDLISAQVQDGDLHISASFHDVCTWPCAVTRTRCIPAKSWKTQRKVGHCVGCVMWFGSSPADRRCVTAYTSSAHVITISTLRPHPRQRGAIDPETNLDAERRKCFLPLDIDGVCALCMLAVRCPPLISPGWHVPFMARAREVCHPSRGPLCARAARDRCPGRSPTGDPATAWQGTIGGESHPGLPSPGLAYRRPRVPRSSGAGAPAMPPSMAP